MSLLEHLGTKLASSDAEERREAAVDLGRVGRPAVPLLLRALADTDWRVRKTAVEALVALGGEDVTSGLVRHLSAEDNAGARNSAIEALAILGAASVPALLPLLKNNDPDVRKFAIDVLGDIQDRRAVPDLIDAVRDGDENVRVAAAEALGKIRDGRAVDVLVSCLSASTQGWLDYAAAEALGEIGDERALGPLLAALDRSSLREPVLESLGKIGNAATLAPLISGLSDPLRIVREVSIGALYSIHRKSQAAERGRIVETIRGACGELAAVLLKEVIETSGGHLQRAALAILGWCGRPDAVPVLLGLLREEDMEEPVAQALRSIGAGAAPQLISRLHDDNVLVRRVAAVVLGDLGRREAEPALIGMLGDENGHVRGAAAEALGRLKTRSAVPALIHLLEDEYEQVQECAIRALASVGDESATENLFRDFSSRDAGMRRNIVRLLGMLGSAAAVDALAFALKDAESAVRKAVVAGLSALGGQGTLRPLLLAITDDDPEVRMLAAEALARTGAEEAGNALVPLLDDEDLWVRAAAARGLGALAPGRFSAVLTSHLDQSSDIFLLALVEVLGRAADPAACGPLLALADHEDHEVRKTVLLALGSFDWDRVRPTVISRLFDPHWSVRKTAAELLRHRRDPATDQILLRLAEEDPDPSVRRSAREALGT